MCHGYKLGIELLTLMGNNVGAFKPVAEEVYTQLWLKHLPICSTMCCQITWT